MKKFFRNSIYVFTMLMVALMMTAYYILQKLPSASQISNQILSKGAEPAPLKKAPFPEQTLSATETGDQIRSSEAKNEGERILSENHVVEELIFDRQQPLVNVCDHLSEAGHSPVTTHVSQEQFFESISEAVKGNQSDPIANSIFAPVRYDLRLPKAQSFFDEVRDSQAKGEGSLFDKAGFYAKGLGAYQEMQAHNREMNDISNHAYYLFLMTEVIQQNPQMAQNSELSTYCYEIQSKLLAGHAFDLEASSREMLKFLEYAHVKPEDVGFDPNYKSEVKVEFSPQQFSIGFGWVDKYVDQKSTATN